MEKGENCCAEFEHRVFPKLLNRSLAIVVRRFCVLALELNSMFNAFSTMLNSEIIRCHFEILGQDLDGQVLPTPGGPVIFVSVLSQFD